MLPVTGKRLAASAAAMAAQRFFWLRYAASSGARRPRALGGASAAAGRRGVRYAKPRARRRSAGPAAVGGVAQAEPLGLDVLGGGLVERGPVAPRGRRRPARRGAGASRGLLRLGERGVARARRRLDGADRREDLGARPRSGAVGARAPASCARGGASRRSRAGAARGARGARHGVARDRRRASPSSRGGDASASRSGSPRGHQGHTRHAASRTSAMSAGRWSEPRSRASSRRSTYARYARTRRRAAPSSSKSKAGRSHVVRPDTCGGGDP